MDMLQHVRDLYAAGQMHDALEAAQAACDRAPKDSEAWWLLGRVSRHAGLVAASDVAFERAARLDKRFAMPHRVSAERFRALIDESRSALPEAPRQRLEGMVVRPEPMPSAAEVAKGLDPDALTRREKGPQQVLVLFQVNHENRSASESALRKLIGRSLSQA